MSDFIGLEELARRILRLPGSADPLSHKGDKVGIEGLVCPLDGGKLGIHYKQHQDGASGIAVAWCSRRHSNIDAVAAAVGMSTSDLRANNELLWAKYRQYGRPVFSVSEADVSRWVDNLWADKALLGYLTNHRLISPDITRAVRLGHDGERYTRPVVQDTGPFVDRLIGVRRYLPNPPAGVDKVLSAPGSRVGLYPYVPPRSHIALVEGESDCEAALSLGLAAVTNTGGARCWRSEWSERLAGRHVSIVYDRDKAGVEGAIKVAPQLRAVGCTVCIVKLPMPYRETHGNDVTDFIKSGGNLRRLLNETNRAQIHERPRPIPRDARTNSSRVGNSQRKNRAAHV